MIARSRLRLNKPPMIERLQDGSREAIRRLGNREPNHPVWGGLGWKVFLDSPDDIRRTVKYIEDNPRKARLPAQQWSFITPYDGWSFGGHGK